MRHAPGSAVQVRLHYGAARLVIGVRNSGGTAGASARSPQDDALSRGGGHGIIGMRERAAMLGGHLSADLTAHDEFVVTAALPLDGEAQQPPSSAGDTDLEDPS
jgi:signal transduction histidine kinase